MAYFSIIVPVYNVKDYLNACLDSIISQSFNDWEALVVDDGSTDGSSDICDSFELADNRIKVFHKENGGPSDARNVAIKNAIGDYILFVDSDDYLLPDALKTIAQKICSFPDSEIIQVSAIEKMFSSNKTLKKYDVDTSFENRCVDGKSFLKKHLPNNLNVAVWSYVFKRSFIENNELLFEKGINQEDEVFTFLALLACNYFVSCDFVCYCYIRRKNSIMSSKSQTKNGFDIIKVCQLLYEKANSLLDDELKSLSLERLVNLYLLGAFWARITYKNSYQPFTYNFLLRNSKTTKTVLKVKLFRYFRHLFIWIYKMKFAHH